MKRIYSIDTIKCIAAFLVVFLHAPIKCNITEYILVIARIAVPIFFLISGYLYENKINNKDKSIASIKKLAKLLLISYLIYIPFECFMYLYDEKSLNVFWSDLFSVSSIIFNLKIASHLWYIRALIYLEIFYLFVKDKNRKLDYIIFPCIIYLVCLIFSKYSIVLFGKCMPVEIYEPVTKFFGTAYVFFTIGIFIKKYINDKNENKKLIFLLIVGIFSVMNLFEYMILERIEKNIGTCNYLCTFFLSISMFCLFIFNPDYGKGSIFEKIGREHSLNIYIYHVIIMRLLNFIISKLGISMNLWNSTRTLIIFIISIMFSIIYNNIKKKVDCNEQRKAIS